MHTIYTTPGLVVGSKPHSEASKVIFIFTREFGLVAAIAQGIRLEKSKLRYNAQDYSLGIFSLVKGKEFWRLVGAEEGGDKKGFSNFSELEDSKNLAAILAPLSLLLRRLLHGEAAQPELFDYLKSVADFLNGLPEITNEQIKTLESVAVFRMLELLGYIGKDLPLQEALGSAPLSTESLDNLGSQREALNKHINKALRESHL